MRPLGVGECLVRAIHSSLVSQFKPAFAEYLWPQKVAVGVPAGLSAMIYGLRLMMEVHPDWVLVKLDIRNAFNEVSRAEVVERLGLQQHLRALVPTIWATYAPASPIYLPSSGMAEAEFRSEEGMRQGDPLAAAGFCVAIHPEVQELDGALGVHGGCAKFDMDDGYAVGPASVVFPAVLDFARSIRELGLELQLSKCHCYSTTLQLQHLPERPPEFPVGQVVADDGAIGYGIDIAGAPLGDAVYVAKYMDSKGQSVVSNVKAIKQKLQDRHLQSLYTVAYYCLSHKFDHWAQHCYPEDVRAAARHVDAALLDTVRACIGPCVEQDALAVRRLRLPARMFGGGMRSVEDLLPAAHLGMLCKVLPCFMDSTMADGVHVPGFLPVLADCLGPQYFSPENLDRRYEVFLASCV